MLWRWTYKISKLFYASIFSNGGGAFRETGALRFFFIPKGALTHHLPAGQAVVTFPLVRPCARLRAKSLAMLGCAPTRLAGPAGAYSQCCRDCGPGHHCLRGGIAAAFPPPAKTCYRQLYRRGRDGQVCPPLHSLLRKRTRKRIEEVKTIGDLSFGGEGHQPRNGPLRMRGLGLYELLRHL